MLFFKLIYGFVIVIRALSLPFFLVNPLAAWLFTLFLDTFDYSFALRSGLTYKKYQNIDKILDLLSRVYFVIAAYFFAWDHAYLFLALFLLRLIGDYLYFKLRSEKFFFIFPNVIEYFFPLYILFLPDPTGQTVVFLLIVATLMKLGHEYWIHINKWIDPVSKAYIKRHPEHRREITQ
jgi:hypothetical protein